MTDEKTKVQVPKPRNHNRNLTPIAEIAIQQLPPSDPLLEKYLLR